MLGILSSLLIGLGVNNQFNEHTDSYTDNYIIIGEDNRNLVENTKYTPYQSIVKIKTFFEDTYIECTGSVIDKNTVLTAAHCVYSSQKESPENIIIVPGANKSEKPFGTYNTNQYKIPSEYENEFNYNYDVALITVNQLNNGKLIGENVNPLKIKKLKDYMYLNVRTIGYPTDKTEIAGTNQWEDHGVTLKQFENKFGYRLDTMSGQSGAPILDNQNKIIGIHTTGNVEQNINYGTQMNKQIYKWIKSH